MTTDSLLAQRPFVLFWCARVATMMAQQMIAVAVGWQVYAMTGRALDLGWVGLVQFLPAFFLVLVAGQVADHFDRRRVMQACTVAEALAAAGLAVGSALDRIDEPSIFALVTVIGAARAFQMPAMQALLPALVPEAMLGRAIATSASAGQTAVIIGPAVGGLVYVAGPHAVYGLCTVFLVVATLLVARIHPLRAAAHARKVSLDSVFAGIRYIRANPALLGAISLDLFGVLLGGAAALFPIYASDILHTGPWGLGLLRSATAVGALGMALWLMHHPIGRRAGRTMLVAVAVFGLGTIVFGLSRSFALSLAALAVVGAADMVSVVVRQTLIQLRTPDAMRGRVGAVNALFIGTSNQLGEFESGVTAAWFGVVPAVVLGGAGTLVVVGLWARVFPELARVDRLESAAL
jgi:MFS family permease